MVVLTGKYGGISGASGTLQFFIDLELLVGNSLSNCCFEWEISCFHWEVLEVVLAVK